MAHFIRLRGAWEIERVEYPDGRGRMRFTRRFGNSAGLKSAQCVWLAIENVVGRAAIGLNGTSLGDVIGSEVRDDSVAQRCPAKFGIASLLQPRNVLVIEVSIDNRAMNVDEADYLGPIRLEVE
jgi:hypothetical protein